MKKILLIIATLLSSLLLFAHAPLLDVIDNNDGYIYLYPGFSNGEPTDDVDLIVVKDKNYNGTEETYDGKMVILHSTFGKMGLKNGEVKLPKPKVGKYLVIFDAGPGHVKEKKGPKLTEKEMDAWKVAIEKDTHLGKWKDIWTGKVK